MLREVDAVLIASSGEVKTPYAYNLRTYLPEIDGLSCEHIFGEVSWAAGESEAILRDDRGERWGHIELGVRLTHPRKSGAMLLRIPVLPPRFRRFRVIQDHELKAERIRCRDQIMANPERAERVFCDPYPKLLREQGLWNDEENRPLTDNEISAGARAFVEAPVHGHYRHVINWSNRIRRLRSMQAPREVLRNSIENLAQAIEDTFATLETQNLSPEVRGQALALSSERHSPRNAESPR